MQAKSMGTTTPKSFCLALPLILLVTHSAGAAALTTLRPFGFPDAGTALPQSELMEASDGKLYGTTASGGTAGKGALFRVNKDGSDLHVLKSFGLATDDAQRPVAALIEASDGLLYGTSSEGGALGRGTVYQLDKGGSNFVVLHHFAGTNGAYPEAKLLEASDGWLYGTASGGGPSTNDYGVVFRLQKTGAGFQLLKSFGGVDGANPEGGLIEATDGGLYGTTCYGGGTNLANVTSTGSSNVGTVFRTGERWIEFLVLKQLRASITACQTNGNYPYGQLVQPRADFSTAASSAAGAWQELRFIDAARRQLRHPARTRNAALGQSLAGMKPWPAMRCSTATFERRIRKRYPLSHRSEREQLSDADESRGGTGAGGRFD
ncbi:MAG: choice-of-anchor tandem repeat GloVer-containing protein [Verrucomicrobiota bacterium]